MLRTTAGLTGTERRYRIRRIFLRREDWYGAKLVTRLTGITAMRLRAMIAAGEIEVHPAEKAWDKSWRMKWPQLAALAIDIWGIETIEEELGEHAAHVFPPLVRTSDITLTLPRYLVTMLEALEQVDGTDANRRVADALLTVAHEHIDELESRIPGFTEAMNFPEGTG